MRIRRYNPVINDVSAIGANAQQSDGKIFNNTNAEGVILDSYDAVAFFTDGKPVKGDARFQFTYDKAIYSSLRRNTLIFSKLIPKNTNRSLVVGVLTPFHSAG